MITAREASRLSGHTPFDDEIENKLKEIEIYIKEACKKHLVRITLCVVDWNSRFLEEIKVKLTRNGFDYKFSGNYKFLDIYW